jgi:uncharacterized protein (TIGR04255 family)
MVSMSSTRLEGAVAAIGHIPAAPRFQLERPQLAQVVCQVRFSPVLKIQRDDEVIPFQEAVRSDYPRYFKTEAVSILLTPAGVQQQQGAGRLHRFQDTTASFTAVLAPDFVALETTGYVDIDDFAGRIATLAAAVAEHYAPAEMQRIGLRFINELRLGSARPKQEMLNAITPALLGPIGTTELADATVSMQQVVVLADADTNMLVRHGYNPEGGTTVDLAPGQILGPEQSQPFYLLDIDAYAEQVLPYSVEGIEARLRDFNEQIRALFAWAVKEEYRKDKLGQVEVVA